ncbi:MAG: hypothetical protein WCO42_07405 [bacterium]
MLNVLRSKKDNARALSPAWLAVLGAFLLGGCVHTVPEGGAMRDGEATTLVQAIKALNQSPAANRTARKQLAAAGQPAIQLLSDALSSQMKITSADDVMRATRTLRALREMHTPVAIPLCERIMLTQAIPGDIRIRGGLLSEAVRAVCDLFPDPMAVDVYVKFLLEKEPSYSVIRDINLHWGDMVRENNMTVDVLYGLSPLVKSSDPRAGKVLVKILKLLNVKALDYSSIWLLDEDGFTFILQRWDRDQIKRLLRQE